MKITGIALATSIVGIILLIVLAFNLEPSLRDVTDISESDLNSHVKIAGEIKDLKQGKATIFSLKDNSGEIKVVSFQNPKVANGENLMIIGKVDIYYGQLEVIAQEIIKQD